VFPVRHELNSYILFRRNSVFKGLISSIHFLTYVHALNAPKKVTAYIQKKFCEELIPYFPFI
jgi:hypothetical protein